MTALVTGGIACLRRFNLRAVLLLVSASLIVGVCTAQDLRRGAPERSLQAAYLLKFPGYVEWPGERFASATAPIVVGVLGADDLASELAAVAAGRTVRERPISVRRLSPQDELGDLHVLFFSALDDDAERGAAIAAEQSLLTVTVSQAEREASVIQFITVNERVRFEVRVAVAQRNGLRLQSGLLAVAARVEEGAR